MNNIYLEYFLDNNFIYIKNIFSKKYFNQFLYENKLNILFYDFINRVWLIYSEEKRNDLLPRIKFYFGNKFGYKSIIFLTPYYVLEEIQRICEKFCNKEDSYLLLKSLVFNLQNKISFIGLIYYKGLFTFGCYFKHYQFFYNLFLLSKIFDFELEVKTNEIQIRDLFKSIKDYYEKTSQL